jgi:hypothetical protein
MRLLVLVSFVATLGCGAPRASTAPAPRADVPTNNALATQPQAEADAPAEEVVAEPPAITVRGVRTGGALHLEIEGVAYDRSAGSRFEQPEQWVVAATLAGAPLARIMNGSTRVVREGTSTPTRWDVTIAFDTAFRLPGGECDGDPEVVVTAPGAAPTRFVVALVDAPAAARLVAQ